MSKQKNHNRQAGSDRVAGRLAAGILWVQKRWADKMAAIMKTLSRKSRWAVCLCFFVLMIGLNTYLIVSSFSYKPNYLDSKVKVNVPTLQHGPVQARKNTLPDDVGIRIKSFRTHLDSLSMTPGGKRQTDSILKGRQGLLDSIERIEKLYQQLNNQ